MRILVVNDTYYPHVNGASYFTQNLVHQLKNRKHEVAVIGPAESFKNSKRDVDGILVYGIRSTQFLFFNDFKFRYCLPFFNKKYIQQILDEFKPDIVHIQGHFPISRNVLKACKKNKIKIVGTNHFMPDNLTHYIPLGNTIRNFAKNLLWKGFAKIFNQLNQITTPTETAANLIRPYIKKEVKVISNGIDCHRFNPNNKSDHIRTLYKIPNKQNLLYVGRLDKEKNINLILKAAANALQEIDFHLTITGNGAERNNLKDLAKRLGINDKVTFTEFVPDKDLPSLYTTGTCFVIACTVELQSLVTMEAMASGLPIIGVNAMALPELVHDNQNGFLFEPDDQKGLSEKIIKILSDKDLQKRMSEESLKIIQNHHIEKSISAFEEMYRREIAAT
ncbi:MAG: glycosyltransferase, partial [Candidatus Gracilibacteria bacterium]